MTAGFEVPYPVGLGSQYVALQPLPSRGTSTVVANLNAINSLSATISGDAEVGSYPFWTAAQKSQIVATWSGGLPSEEFRIDKALDGSLSTEWHHGSSFVNIGDYVIFQFPTPQSFVRISQDCTGVTGGNFPRGWTIHGSNNGTTWTDLAYDTASVEGLLHTEISPGALGPWLYYRIYITAISGALDQWWVKEFQFYTRMSDVVDHTVPLTVLSPSLISVNIIGRATVTAELFVNSTRQLSCTIAGTSTVQASPFVTNFTFDPRSIIHLYLFTNVGVGFNPTDVYTGTGNIIAQTFPDGHTVLDFWEYLYIYLNVGVGFDPTDDASDRDDFVSQIFPDGHTVFDFWEYLYLYLNVVRGFHQQGQLVIRPGYTRGPILPSAKPPRNVFE